MSQLPAHRTYLLTLLLDIFLFMTIFVRLVLAKRQSWLGAFRPIIFRLSVLSLLVRIGVSFLLPTRAFIAVVVVCNVGHVSLWVWAFNRLHALIRSPEIRAVQVWIHARKVEVVSIYKQVLGEADVVAAVRGKDAGSCAICLQPLIIRSDERRNLSIARLRPRVTLAQRLPTAGVVEVLETPCNHLYHKVCIGKCVSPVCPLCKLEVGRVERLEVPFP